MGKIQKKSKTEVKANGAKNGAKNNKVEKKSPAPVVEAKTEEAPVEAVQDGVIESSASQPEREDLITAAEKLNEVIGLNPPIDITASDDALTEAIKVNFTENVIPQDEKELSDVSGVFKMLGLPWPPAAKKSTKAKTASPAKKKEGVVSRGHRGDSNIETMKKFIVDGASDSEIKDFYTKRYSDRGTSDPTFIQKRITIYTKIAKKELEKAQSQQS